MVDVQVLFAKSTSMKYHLFSLENTRAGDRCSRSYRSTTEMVHSTRAVVESFPTARRLGIATSRMWRKSAVKFVHPPGCPQGILEAGNGLRSRPETLGTETGRSTAVKFHATPQRWLLLSWLRRFERWRTNTAAFTLLRALQASYLYRHRIQPLAFLGVCKLWTVYRR